MIDYVAEVDKILENSKEKLRKDICDSETGNTCDFCGSSGHSVLYTGFNSHMFNSWCVCPKCMFDMNKDDKEKLLRKK